MSPSSAARSREPVPAFRNRRGEAVEASSVTATDAKKQFGRVLEMVLRGGAVVITKHDAPKAILSAVFDAMLARMLTPRARSGMRAAFGASPKALGRAAVTAARKRG